jgi:YggT family protein
MVLGWVGVLAPGGGRWSIPAPRMAHAVTEPVLAPVRRVLPRFLRGGS